MKRRALAVVFLVVVWEATQCAIGTYLGVRAAMVMTEKK